MSYKYDKGLKQNSQILRKNMTKEEKRLWYDFLKDLPVQFKRQKMIGHYIVDFYCAKLKIVIELDGSQHYEEDNIEYDKQRTEFLNELGITVLRYSNVEINTNFQGVCTDLMYKLKLIE